VAAGIVRRMWNFRKIIRMAATSVAAIAFSGLVYPVVSEFFIELAREHGWYDKPSDKVAAMTEWLSFVRETWFIASSTGVIGFALGVWVDAILRRSESIQPKTGENTDKTKNGRLEFSSERQSELISTLKSYVEEDADEYHRSSVYISSRLSL
jgi:hypothetical protein